MRKVIEILNDERPNFNFAWGVNDAGLRLRKYVVSGMKRHGFKDAAPYIRHCIKETSEREESDRRGT